MKEFRQSIPEGMQARVENGEVIYTPIEACQFKVGDVISYDDILFLFEGVNNDNIVLRSYCCNYYVKGDLVKTNGNIGFNYNDYEKATREQELFFKQKCLEKGIWFDKDGKKWILLKEGEVYELVSIHKDSWFFIFKGFISKSKIIVDYASLLAGNVIINEYCQVLYDKVYNISEASKEEKQYFFDKLKEVGKEWNYDNKCIEDIKWKPKDLEKYWYINSIFCSNETKNDNLSYVDSQRINIGNCFKNKEECEKYAEYIRKCSLNYKP